MTTMLEQGRNVLRGEQTPPIARLLGFALKPIEPGQAVFQMEVDEHLHNPMGTLHGGLFSDLADAAMGYERIRIHVGVMIALALSGKNGRRPLIPAD
jgi:acyl-coenzyme A thioesterase PaaI-like protein